MLLLSGSGARISIRFLQVIRMTKKCLITGSICVSQAISPIIMLPLRLTCRLQESWDIMAIIPNRSRNISASRRLRDIWSDWWYQRVLRMWSSRQRFTIILSTSWPRTIRRWYISMVTLTHGEHPVSMVCRSPRTRRTCMYICVLVVRTRLASFHSLSQQDRKSSTWLVDG